MVTANDIAQLDRIGQVIGLRIAEVDRSIAETADGPPAGLPSQKAFEGLSLKLLLWQNRLKEMSQLVKQSEGTLHEVDGELRETLAACGELRIKADAVPEPIVALRQAA